MLKTSFVVAIVFAPLAWATCAAECQYQNGDSAACSTTGSTRTCVWTYDAAMAASNQPGVWNPPVGASNVQFMLIGGAGGDVGAGTPNFYYGGLGANITFTLLPTSTAGVQYPTLNMYPGQNGGSVNSGSPKGGSAGGLIDGGFGPSGGGANGGSASSTSGTGGAGSGSASAIIGNQNGGIAPYGIAGGGGGAALGDGGDAGLDNVYALSSEPAESDGSSGSFTSGGQTYSITAAQGAFGNANNGGLGGTYAPSTAIGQDGSPGSYDGEQAGTNTQTGNYAVGGGAGVKGLLYGSGAGGGGYAGGGAGATVQNTAGTQQLAGSGGAGGSFIQEQGGFTSNPKYASSTPGAAPLIQVTYTVLLNGSGMPTRRKLARRARMAARLRLGQ